MTLKAHVPDGQRVDSESLDRPYADHGSGASVAAGEGLQRGKQTDQLTGRGTASVVVKKPSEPSKRFLITADHVLGKISVEQGVAKENAYAVYAPELSTCSKVECNSPIGRAVEETLRKLGPEKENTMQKKREVAGRDYAVDAGLIELAPDTDADNEIPEIGVIDPTPRDLIAEWNIDDDFDLEDLPTEIAVRKFGATTGFTRGKIIRLQLVDLDYWVPDPNPDPDPDGDNTFPDAQGHLKRVSGQGLAFEVHADPDQDKFEHEYELDVGRMRAERNVDSAGDVEALFGNSMVTATVEGWPDDATIHIEGTLFSQSGDSGAPIVDTNNKLIGFLQGGKYVRLYLVDEEDPVDVVVGHSRGVFARACLEELGVEIMPQSQLSAGPRVARPGLGVRRAGFRPFDRRHLDRAVRDLRRCARGADLVRDAERHFEEVRELVHHRRRVMVTWHRSQGPAFADAAMRGAERPNAVLPKAVESISRLDFLKAMGDALRREGSAGLKAALDRHQELIHEASRNTETLSELVDAVVDGSKRCNGTECDGGPAHSPRSLEVISGNGVPGSADIIVRDEMGFLLFLTCHHIAYADGAGLPVTLHARESAGEEPKPFGEAIRGRFGNDGGSGVFVDCALVAPSSGNGLRASRRRATTAFEGLKVRKWGAATGYTEGEVVTASFIDRPRFDGTAMSAPGQILVRSADPAMNFAAAGDSGAGLYDEQGRIVGLIWGVTTAGDGVASPIDAVLEALDVQLPGDGP